jgi:hypothetical protein
MKAARLWALTTLVAGCSGSGIQRRDMASDGSIAQSFDLSTEVSNDAATVSTDASMIGATDGGTDGAAGCGALQAPVLVATRVLNQLALLWTGQELAVLWLENPTGAQFSTVWLRRYAISGVPTSSAVPLCNDGCSLEAAAWSGHEIVIAFVQSSPTGDVVSVRRFDIAGTPILDRVDVFRLANRQRAAALGGLWWNGSEYGIGWHEWLGGLPMVDRFTRLAADGAPLGTPMGFGQGSTVWAQTIAGAWNGLEWGVVWGAGQVSGGEITFQLYFDRLVRNGIGSAPLPASHSGAELVWNGHEYGMATTKAFSDPIDSVFFTRVGKNGTIAGGPSPVLTFAGGQAMWHALAWNGSEYGLVASERSAGLSFVVLGSDGKPIRKQFELEHTMAAAPGPRNVWAGDRFAIVWPAFIQSSNSTDVHLTTVCP